MKKSQFDGTDYAIVEKYKAPIEKFNDNDDLQIWALDNSAEILNSDFSGRKESTPKERKKVLDSWAQYLYSPKNKKYTNAEKYLIVRGITQELKPNDDNLPPVLNRQILANTMYDLKKDIQTNKRLQFNFNDRYKSNLREYYLEQEKSGKWIVIPSEINDPENYRENVCKLRTLSPDGWCTKNDYADIYLKTGDFHIYTDNGETQLGLRFDGDEIQSIEGQKNDLKIPVDYLDVCKSYIAKNHYKMNDEALSEIQKADEKKRMVERITANISEPIKNGETEKILNYFGILTKKNTDGKLIISNYKKPANFDFTELGINEDRMFKDIVKIEGDAELDGGVTNLGALKEIGGDAEIGIRMRDFGALEKVGGTMNVYSYDIKNADNLKSVRGGIQFFNGAYWDLYIGLLEKGIPTYIC